MRRVARHAALHGLPAAFIFNPANNTGSSDGRMSEMILTYEAWRLNDSHTIGIADNGLLTMILEERKTQ